MANTSKKTAAAVKETVIAAAEAPAVKKETAPAAEKKAEPKKPGRKPAAKKEAAPAAKKEAAPKTEKKAAAPKTKKAAPAAKKADAPKAEKKPAAKPAKKPAAKKTAEKPAAKRGAKKKQLSYEEIVDAARKKAMGANVTKIKVHIAANFILTGNFSENKNANEDKDKNQFYIDINPETESINVQPYRYEENTFQITADAEELYQVLTGKKNIYDAISDGDFHLEGRAKPMVLFINSVL